MDRSSRDHAHQLAISPTALIERIYDRGGQALTWLDSQGLQTGCFTRGDDRAWWGFSVLSGVSRSGGTSVLVFRLGGES